MSSEPPIDPAPPARRTQAERHAATRAALLAAGRRLFGERGFAAVSAEEVVSAAGVTRGAMYHHFRDKGDLFRAVYLGLEDEIASELTARVDAAPGALEGLVGGVPVFLDVCARPEVRRIALVDAPTVLGWASWREIEHDHALGILTARLEAAAEQGVSLPGPVEVVAALLFSTLIEAALAIAHADDPEDMRVRYEPTLVLLAARSLGVGAVAPPDTPSHGE